MAIEEGTLLQLLEQIRAATAAATAAAVNANAAANTANAAANQASSGAAAGVAGARTQSNVESALDRAMSTVQQLQQTQVESDIDTPEAWKANVKRTYDIHQTYDLEGMNRNRLHFDNAIIEYQTHVKNTNQLTLQALSNNQNQSNTGNGMLIDRTWNINETDLAAKAAAIATDAIWAKLIEAGKVEAGTTAK